MKRYAIKENLISCVFSHDVMAVIFVQNNETVAMFVSPVGVEVISYVKAFFWIDAGHVSENTE